LKSLNLKVAAWQVWNEPNAGVFWIGGPEPARYSALLKAAYPRIKAADPAAIVVTGGLVHNDFYFVESLYRHGAGDSFDAVGTHMSTACLTPGPGFYERNQDNGRIDKYYFTAYREVHQSLADRGHGDKPIFMEIGWSTAHDQPCNVGNKKGPSGVTEAEQARFLTEAYQCLASDGYVRAAAWFSLQDATRQYHSYDSRMGLVDFNGNLRPSFGAMQTVARGITPSFCGGKVDRDLPSAKIDVPDQYFTRLVVRGSATDPTTPIKKIELWVDGKRVEGANGDGPTYNNDWFGSTKLGYGKHTIELRAYDEALNVARASKVVTKVDPDKATGTYKPRLAFAAKKVGRGKVRVSARVQRALDFPEDPKGRLRIFFERRTGGRWKPYSRFTKGISKPVRLTYAARRPGKWRVWGRLAVDAPYKALRTKKYVFKLR
ncbi:MAG TPA: hypothetical protein VM266_12155, partial [Solirubrobacteraceae bacterium]|nr:hypothetical protein [Solirubrobacteraceae bacterium]